MAYQEVISQFNDLIENSKSFSEEDDDIWDNDVKALKMAIEALEKQLPKKPIFKIKEQYNEEYYLKKEYYICPNCGKTMVVQNHKEITKKEYNEIKRWLSGLQLKYCGKCGQAIDWEGTE